VLSTIHQPSPEAFALFDKLVLLAEGRLIYQGPAAKAVQFFEQSPFGFSRRPGANPADFVIAVAGGFLTAADGRSVTAGELAVHSSSFQSQRDEQAHTVNEAIVAGREESVTEIDDARHGVTSVESVEGTAMSDACRTSLWNQVKVLLHRRVLVMSREPGMSASMIRYG
jgi:ABC-type multidrug transport system ATPase subunit